MLFCHLKYRRDDIPAHIIYIHIYAYTDIHTCTYICRYIYINTYMGFPAGSVVKNLPARQETQEMQVQFLGWEDPLEEEMATHFSILAWEIPWTEEPGRLQSLRS